MYLLRREKAIVTDTLTILTMMDKNIKNTLLTVVS